MGCFDSIIFNCPSCGKQNEEQSKAGDCLMGVYSLSEVPLKVAADIAGDDLLTCYNCKASLEFVIVSFTPNKARCAVLERVK